jgi:hypothetical protein
MAELDFADKPTDISTKTVTESIKNETTVDPWDLIINKAMNNNKPTYFNDITKREDHKYFIIEKKTEINELQAKIDVLDCYDSKFNEL